MARPFSVPDLCHSWRFEYRLELARRALATSGAIADIARLRLVAYIALVRCRIGVRELRVLAFLHEYAANRALDTVGCSTRIKTCLFARREGERRKCRACRHSQR